MSLNTSKSRQSRFWEKWRANGAMPQYSFIFTQVTVPPPTEGVTRTIVRIGCLITGLERTIQRRTYCFTPAELPRLLKNVHEARYWGSLCEHLIAKERLSWVLPKDDHGPKSFVRWRILRIFRLLDWCLENDRRDGYTWFPVSERQAA